jgi:hypothetical protein
MRDNVCSSTWKLSILLYYYTEFLVGGKTYLSLGLLYSRGVLPEEAQ